MRLAVLERAHKPQACRHVLDRGGVATIDNPV